MPKYNSVKCGLCGISWVSHAEEARSRNPSTGQMEACPGLPPILGTDAAEGYDDPDLIRVLKTNASDVKDPRTLIFVREGLNQI